VVIAVCISCEYETPDYPDLDGLKNKLDQDRARNQTRHDLTHGQGSFVFCPECKEPDLMVK